MKDNSLESKFVGYILCFDLPNSKYPTKWFRSDTNILKIYKTIQESITGLKEFIKDGGFDNNLDDELENIINDIPYFEKRAKLGHIDTCLGLGGILKCKGQVSHVWYEGFIGSKPCIKPMHYQ